MALTLHVHSFANVRGTGDRVTRVTFRGVSHYSKVCENASEEANFDEVFEWPVARPIDCQEQVEIQLMVFNKYLSNRRIGTFSMVLQRLIDVSELSVTDYLLDDNNVVLQTSVKFDLTYSPPGAFARAPSVPCRTAFDDGDIASGDPYDDHRQSGSAAAAAAAGDGDDDTRLLIADKGCSSDGDSTQSSPKPKPVNRLGSVSRTTGIRSIRTLGKIMKFGRQRAISEASALPEPLEVTSNVEDDFVPCLEPSEASENQDEAYSCISRTRVPVARSKCEQKWEYPVFKEQDFQVSITVIEVRQLAGFNMNPVVCVQVGDQKKYTSVKESTSCPYYNEYFVFDFHLSPSMLFDKIITLTVMHSRNLLRAGTVVGAFKIDVGTVYSANDHQFYHKWAILNDPEDINSGSKGYLKCDIAVIGKGDNLKVPQKTEKDEDDIVSNLLLPDGVPANRQKAKFSVRIFRAEDLPRMTIGLMANVKKALTGESKDLVDPFVQVWFAGLQAKTSVKKGTCEPVWNEQIIFTEMFPPLCRRFKIQIRDNDAINAHVIGTHFIDLAKISNDGEKGYLPTFGPSWVNFYGSTRNFSLLEASAHLNEGLSEGVSYRGRLLMSLKTEILDDRSMGPSMVEVEPTMPVSDNSLSNPEEFFLFGCLFEASMIDRKHSERPIKFELSIGNYGNALEGQSSRVRRRSEVETETEEEDEQHLITDMPSGISECHSITGALMPLTKERYYYYLPIEGEKPCLWLNAQFEDHRRRHYHSNMIEKICEKLEAGICEVNEELHRDRPSPEKLLRIVLEELAMTCGRYLALSQTRTSVSTVARTRLDREHQKLCQQEIDQIGKMSRTLKPTVNKSNVRDKLKLATGMLLRLRIICQDPQDALPDVFIWLIQNNRRLAYHRIPAKDIIFSIVDEEKGQNCGKVQTFYLKLPSKKGTQSAGWTVQAKLQLYLWLGLSKHKKELLTGLPAGYEDILQLQKACQQQCSPPPAIIYTERHSFQLRAHMYQARGLIGSDESGLSDPYARVVFSNASLCTQVIDETLNPTWDETLILNEITLYGTIEFIKEEPPVIVVEIFDQDRIGKSEFIGRALARPVVKASHEKYEKPAFPPLLTWFDIFRGSDRAGELLAAFELLQLAPPGDDCINDLPPFHVAPSNDRDRGPLIPVPPGIRPTLIKHRIEVLFWGVREMKRYQFLSVDKPRVDIECAGHVLSSSVVQNMQMNPNFTVPVKYFDVDLPDNELYCPPITIRCVECRNFGRFVLIGSHVIDNIHKFIYSPVQNRSPKGVGARNAEKLEAGSQLIITDQSSGARLSTAGLKDRPGGVAVSMKPSDVSIVVDEEMPLISKMDTTVVMVEPGVCENSMLPPPSSSKKKEKGFGVGNGDGDNDLESLDWWAKYHASVETAIREVHDDGCVQVLGGDVVDLDNRISRSQGQSSQMSGYGAIPNGLQNGNGDDPDYDPKEAKRFEKELLKIEGRSTAQKRYTMRGLSKAVSLANKLSPKSKRKKENLYHVAEFQMYSSELEAQQDFGGFKEWLHTFDLYRGKRTEYNEDDDSRVVGKFKGGLVIYRLPLVLADDDEGSTSESTVKPKPCRLQLPSESSATGNGVMSSSPVVIFQGLPNNDPIHVLVRVYIVKAIDLHPADINGKADPYIIIKLGQTTINDKEHYISKQLNPVFGKCFEVEATFPHDSLLKVQVYDWDLIGSDDLIGETNVDLENRFYSKHRATCGLAKTYETDGYNVWRDPLKPMQILSKLCKENKLDGPFYQTDKIQIGRQIFTAPSDMHDDQGMTIHWNKEQLALAVLHRWQDVPKVGCRLVPEHVETRALYNPEKPGIEQGKLEMWVDMFPMDMPLPGPPVDISPRKPKSYELRIIVWNTEDVVLEDDAFFTGEKMSDIYIKGWIKGSEDMQSTDIHYRSLTGEGNFNWRFIYPFDYLVAEEKIVISRRDTMFSWDETEVKIPARLNLQVWDADHFSSDDFLGSLTLDLNQFPRGAKSSKQCTLDMLKVDGSVPQMSLFKHKRVKGWWPFHIKNENDKMELTGKLEAELQLLTVEEAEKHPAGLGRNEPEALDKPNRPDTSFIWFLNPLKSIRYILWHNYRWVILKAIALLLLALLLGLFFYNMPGYMVKKMIGA